MESAAAMVQRLARKLDARLVETHISWVRSRIGSPTS